MSKAPKQSKRLLLTAAVVLIVAAVFLLYATAKTGDSAQTESIAAASGSNIEIPLESIGTQASYFDYDADGVTVELMAVLASDGTVRLALNTCQVCNGSPYAYFEQSGDNFICQNCKNVFTSTDIGKESGGCNPVPITSEYYMVENETIVVQSSFLDKNAARFVNWKSS